MYETEGNGTAQIEGVIYQSPIRRLLTCLRRGILGYKKVNVLIQLVIK